MALSWNTEAAAGGGSGKTQPIAVQFWLDYLHPIDGRSNLLLDDSADETSYPTLPATEAYIDGINYVTAKVGRDQNINFNLGGGSLKKPAVRHCYLGGAAFDMNGALKVQPVPPGWEPVAPYTYNPGLRPTLTSTMLPKTMGAMYGFNFDDTPQGVIRHVDAFLNFQDQAGRAWRIELGRHPLYYNNDPTKPYWYAPQGSCVSVERLAANGRKSRWRFWTEPITDEQVGMVDQHIGYLYTYPENPTDPLILVGLVDLPFSGTIESLSDEPTPANSTGYDPGDGTLECTTLPSR